MWQGTGGAGRRGPRPLNKERRKRGVSLKGRHRLSPAEALGLAGAAALGLPLLMTASARRAALGGLAKLRAALAAAGWRPDGPAPRAA